MEQRRERKPGNDKFRDRGHLGCPEIQPYPKQGGWPQPPDSLQSERQLRGEARPRWRSRACEAVAI